MTRSATIIDLADYRRRRLADRERSAALILWTPVAWWSAWFGMCAAMFRCGGRP